MCGIPLTVQDAQPAYRHDPGFDRPSSVAGGLLGAARRRSRARRPWESWPRPLRPAGTSIGGREPAIGLARKRTVEPLAPPPPPCMGPVLGCPVNSSIVDTVNGVLSHLHARDVTFLLVSEAPLEKLQAYKRRMGWRVPWVSTAQTDFNFDLGFSHTEEQAREAVAQMRATGPRAQRSAALETTPESGAGLPPIVEHNARSTGTDVVATSPRVPASARSCTTTMRSTTHTRRRGADWSFSWATTRSSTTHPRGPRRGQVVAALDPPTRRV